MSIFIVYTARHTGTFFVADFLRACFTEGEKENFDHISDSEFDELGLGDAENHLHPSFEQFELKLYLEYILKRSFDKEALIIHCHNKSVLSTLYSELCCYDANIPVFVPLRDPLMTLNTILWRDMATRWEVEGNLGARWEDIRFTLSTIGALSRLPRRNIFYFPIDLYTEEKDRRDLCEQACVFAKIEPNATAMKYAASWKAANPTLHGEFSQQKEHLRFDDEYFSAVKRAIANKDRLFVEKHRGLEIAMLRHEEFQHFYYEIGYRDLLWFKGD